MGNAAVIDIHSTPVRWHQFEPDASDPESIREAERNAYVDAWASDELAEQAYPAPLEEWITEHADEVLAALRDYRKGDPDEFEASAGRLMRQLESIVKEQV
ncbi:hypothetical protein MHM84_03465 [Halomonas sp. McH1-25]|uniref:hypothetical protein n=1 Tax=unclassified Halomonas TaxID=2609666 RepID=UPI001EF544D4|nr:MULTISPECIES: hypothetical protein [unclassified Halomonas]MCG7598830.1 hypothetical protein [Halomonas sp. McH1-25]MCP1340793.1 hypothetical protein [Halomonas sp. FL8]MCP1362216.1 hypothetical protein [Halomonas sp. BBD45]MCP1364120.1 hypothetical protein [Halomonas sp. BBD48]